MSVKVRIEFSEPTTRVYRSLAKLIWEVLRYRWKNRSKKHYISVYAFISSVMEISDKSK